MNSHTDFHQVQFETFEILNPGSTRVDYCKTLDEKSALEKQTMVSNVSSLQPDILEQWETEKGNTHPHESITQLFESHGKSLDKFMEQGDITVDHKTNITILKTTLSQLKLYEQESLGKEEASASEDVRNYIVFEKLYSYRKSTSRNPDFFSGRCKEINALIKETKDVQNKYFTKINGLREEISVILNAVARYGNYKEKWLRMQCQSFASHHVFALYAAKVQMCLNELNVKNMLMKNESKQKRLMKQKEFVICECGESTTRSNLSKHPSFKIHQKLMAMKTSGAFKEQEPIVVLCEEIRIPVKVVEPEVAVLVVEEEQKVVIVEEIPKQSESIVLKFDFGFVPAYDDEKDPEEVPVNHTKTAIEADRESYEAFFTHPDNDPIVCMRMHYKKLLRVFDEMFKISPPQDDTPPSFEKQEDPEAKDDNDDDDNEDEDDDFCPFDWMFEILNLGGKSMVTEELMKKAYRRLAIKFHPDKNNGSLEAAEKFKKLNEAYHTLIPYYTKKFVEPEIEAESPQYEPTIFETDLENAIVETPDFEPQEQQPVTNNNDDDDDDDDPEIVIEVDEETQKEFDKLLKNISRKENKPPPRESEEIHRMKRLNIKYHHILTTDPFVLGCKTIINSLLMFQCSINEKSSLARRIDDMVDEKLFAMFKQIKMRYGCGLPNIDFLDAYEKHFQRILLHAQLYEVMDNGMTPNYEEPQTKLDYTFDNKLATTEYWALMNKLVK